MKVTVLLNALLPLALLASAAGQSTCPAPDECLDCGTLSSCFDVEDSDTPAEHRCGEGKACKVTGGEAVCVDAAEVPGCACAAPVTCDPYNATRLLVCSEGTLVAEYDCPGGKECQASNGMCVEIATEPPTTAAPTTTPSSTTTGHPTLPPPANCSADDAFVNRPTSADCRQYALCDGDAPILERECEVGFYLDEISGTCAPSPPSPCSGCTDGYCANLLDCNLYEKCVDGKKVFAISCPEETPHWDYKNGTCVDDVGACDPRTACVHNVTGITTSATTSRSTNMATTVAAKSSDAAVGTTTPSGEVATTAAAASTSPSVTAPPDSVCSSKTAYMMWADPENCKGYYKCLPTASNSYQMYRGSCPGRLEFNPSSKLCDLPGHC